jgi:hypothetical protein
VVNVFICAKDETRPPMDKALNSTVLIRFPVFDRKNGIGRDVK